MAESPQLQGDKRTMVDVTGPSSGGELGVSVCGRAVQARSQLVADRLRTHKVSLVADEELTASKKKAAEERKANASV